MPGKFIGSISALVCAVAISFFNPAAMGSDSADQVRAIRECAGVFGGLVVHLGAADGKLTAALSDGDGYLVQGLLASAQDLQKVRQYVDSLGLAGKVSLDTLDGHRLPYADNLVNLIVVSDRGRRVTEDEFERVLAPGGVAVEFLADEEQPTPRVLFRKRCSKNIDQWTHYLHDATGNAVAHDEVAAAPRHLQWADGPEWSRSHEYDSSLCAMVSASGRLFTIFDEGPTGIIDPRIPDRWVLKARDAFSGVLLWSRPIDDWGWKAWRPQMAERDWRLMPSYRCASPLSLPRRLVAVGDRVYTTLGYRAPVTALSATTGETIQTFAGTENTDEILYHESRLILCVRAPSGTPAGEKAKSRRGQPESPAVIMVLDADTGRQLWHSEPLPVTVLSLAASKDAVYCHSAGDVICRELATGRELWRAPVGMPGVPLVVYDHTVICAGRQQLLGLSATEGTLRWELPAPRGFGVANPPDLFVAAGLVWYGQGSAEANSITGYDPTTGKPVRTIDYGPLVTRGHHARCYRSKATDNYLLLPKRAVEFVDLHGDRHSRNNWVRGACRYGVLPCNGLLYSTPHPCFCYAGVKLGGFLALAPEAPEARALADSTSPRLQRFNVEFSSAAASQADDSWPSYRHDAQRTGCTTTAVQTPVRVNWQSELGGRLTPPVIAEGRVFVARADAGVICCLDSTTGQLLWRFHTGGRLDSSPTWYRGRLIFGSADGYVYCLRASDGAPVWQFRAAAQDCRVVSHGQVESAWPVHGSVLLWNDVVYFTAGRSSYLDGGITIYGLDPTTGEQLHQTRLDSSQTDSTVLDEAAYAMEGAKSDILVTDGTLLYLFHNAFDAELKKRPVPVLGEPGVRNLGERQFTEHLFSNAGFLDDSWFSRNHWMLGDHWTAFNFAHQAPKAGELVVFDADHAFAVKCFARRNVLSPLFFPATDGYFVVADSRATRAVLVNPRQQPQFLTWLPQEGKLQKCWNLDVGFARDVPPTWMISVPVRIRGLVRTGNALFAAGPPDACDPDDPLAALEGRRGATLLTFDPRDGRQLAEYPLVSPPVFDGLAAAAGGLYLSTVAGSVLCLSGD